MPYVDAMRQGDMVLVSERLPDGSRNLTEYRAPFIFYHAHPTGQNQTIFGQSCKKFATTDSRKFRRVMEEMKDEGIAIFESDINPVVRCLHDQYAGAEAPVLHIGLFDIEVDFDPERGFAPTDNPFNRITAISVYLTEIETLFTLTLAPKTLSAAEAQAICDTFEHTHLCKDEQELLGIFVQLIENVDVLSGWNSEGFDIPYLINRIKRISPGLENQLCLWDVAPREREYLAFGQKRLTYDLVGRVHLDYLLLYKKHNTKQEQSYKLDSIGEIETGETKIAYEGTLDALYNKDFPKFIAYNRQDTMLLAKIDKKRKFIELANQIAHANCVLLKTTMGSVALVETAIINEMHAMGFVVPDRKPRPDAGAMEEFEPQALYSDDDDEDDDPPPRFAAEPVEKVPVVGAYVAVPKVGLHRFIGAVDINSLYPSTIRALNMSPETIVGQVRPTETMALVEERIAAGTPRAEAWEGIFATLEFDHMIAQDDHEVTVDFEDGRTVVYTGAELHDYIFSPLNDVCMTANGTIFRTDKEGMIPALLAKWYSERKTLQASQRMFGSLAKGVEIDPELAAMLRAS